MTVVLRAMERRDLDAVVAIETDASPSPWSPQLFEGELALPPSSRHWLVAVADGEVVGFAGMMYAASTAHLMNLAVARGHTRRRIGLRLCVALFVDAKSRGAADLTLEVRASNDAAIALYEKLDMTAVGTRAGYYPDGEDAVIFWIHDLASADPESLLHGLGAP